MNNRSKPAAKKIIFEPKVPPVSQNIKIEQPKPIEQQETPQEKEITPTQSIKGTFAPKSFATNREFNVDSHEFIMCLPEDMTSDCSLIVFTDGSYGIRWKGEIYECDYSQLDDSILVDIDDKVKKIGNPEFILTGYSYKSK